MNRKRLMFLGMLMMALGLMSQTTKPAVKAVAAGKPVAGGLKGSMDRGQKVYHDQCLSCHMADARGVSNLNPPLVKTKFVLGDKTTLVQIVLKGMSGPVDIEGETYHNVMAPHPELNDQQIADVLTYIRNSFGNKASVVTAAEVKAIRAKTK